MQRCCKVDAQEASGMTARVILFAAMAAFLDDVCLGFKCITDGATGTMMVAVNRWFNDQSPPARDLLTTRP